MQTLPFPANAVMILLAPSTRRITLFPESEMKKFPAPFTDTLSGEFRVAFVANPPSPECPAVPVPGNRRDDPRCAGVNLANYIVVRVRHIQVALRIQIQAQRAIQSGADRWPSVAGVAITWTSG